MDFIFQSQWQLSGGGERCKEGLRLMLAVVGDFGQLGSELG